MSYVRASEWKARAKGASPYQGVRAPSPVSNRSRGLNAAMERFLNWNCDGVGKPKGNYRSSTFWHSNHILFLYDAPIARFMWSPDGFEWVLFTNRSMHWSYNVRWQLSDEEKYRVIPVSNLCVFGAGVGQVSSDEFMLDSVRRQLLSYGDWQLERLHSLSPLSAVDYLDNYFYTSEGNRVKRKTNHGFMRHYMIDYALEQIAEASEKYDMLRRQFNMMDWEVYPQERLVAAIKALVEAKVAHYRDPVRAARRERAAARRDAVIALNGGM